MNGFCKYIHMYVCMYVCMYILRWIGILHDVKKIYFFSGSSCAVGSQLTSWCMGRVLTGIYFYFFKKKCHDQSD